MNMKMTISDISRDISDEARRNNLGFTNHANKRLRERKIPKNLLVSAIAETGGIVMTEDKNGDHNGKSERYVVLADIFGQPVRVLVSPDSRKKSKKYSILTAYAGNDYFQENTGKYGEAYARCFKVKRTPREARKAFEEVYLQEKERIEKKNNEQKNMPFSQKFCCFDRLVSISDQQ